ncbi:MAG: hypothetical protein KVP17_000253 [Porospora cf. gigantea B]|uniref:uncharacterized protein n=1 Tax=Porospora cf. gigantea B TaxID=2853592 RepID=UPI003571DD01|nr:MAG: hypothetical protein KVP17_000253 [Porospora cf. gigantea B]
MPQLTKKLNAGMPVDVPSVDETLDTRLGRIGRILIIVTGGTICMEYSGEKNSLRPIKSLDSLRNLPELQDASLPKFDIESWPQLVDSSDIRVTDWVRICQVIRDQYGQYDGFVVLHGTDTMAYSACILSFMLENLGKPVVFTGSMLPLCHIQTDGRKNLAVAMMIAGFSQITEVVVLFGSKVMRGNRTVKVDCDAMEAFDSPKYVPLGKVGVDVTIDEQLLMTPSKRGFRIFTNMLVDNVIVVKLTPMFPASILRNVFSTDVRPFGVILELFGSGTAPCGDAKFVDVVKDGIAAGIDIVCITQCPKGTCSLLTYENGVRLYDMGVIEGKDLMAEAAFAKLAYLFGKGYKGPKLRMLMEKSLRGELTEDIHKVTGQSSLSIGSDVLPVNKSARNLLASKPEEHTMIMYESATSKCKPEHSSIVPDDM